MAKCIVNVGATGTGKSTETRAILMQSSQPEFIYDVNGEYKDYKGAISNMNFKDFLSNAKNKTNTTIVFEEATIFFKQQGSTEDMLNLLVRKRHSNNIIILNFHSLRKVPLDILDFTNYMIIHKTNDLDAVISKKYEEHVDIWNAYKEVKESLNHYEKRYVKFN